MRRLPLLALLALVLATPAFALPGAEEDGSLSVKRGRGYVGLRFDGAVLGRVAHGSVRISDPLSTDGLGPEFFGCDYQRDVNDTTTYCSGDDIRFRAFGGKYSVRVKGRGIFVSAVGHGKVMLDGRGDETDRPDGVYSFNDADYESLPDDPRQFVLAAPSAGG
ncbi:MAG: hypothetical protein M3R70_07465 [Actinomycetota bacterium]|nr:hypothetical protein [Actinomycetota bacterium]